MTFFSSLRFASFILFPIAQAACGDDSSEPRGGSNQGGDNAGASQAGGGGSGGESAGGSHAGGESAGGQNAGGESAGGQNAGGDGAGGGASLQDCQAAANQIAEIFKACGFRGSVESDCTDADYDQVVCIGQCAEAAPCGAFTGDDPQAAAAYQACLQPCL